MPAIPELTKLEKRAEEALALPSFPINFTEIRKSVRSLLTEVGRYGFFDEYTNHSFDHVLGMLRTAEWIIPAETLEDMTSGDALILVLSTYFHDLGLLISRDEFAARDGNSEYQKFLTSLDRNDKSSKEYLSKVDRLVGDARDRFLYQEFVRNTHGERVRSWIEGTPLDDGGSTETIRQSLHDLIGKLDQTVRRDLALVCESHTRDDLEDTAKYKLSQPYGNDEQEWVNLQYVAAILRTIDLLQITKERAPSTLLKVINPIDPISQTEWHKQGAVRSVRPRPGIDRDGKADKAAVADTIEVHARFKEADGFFGLTSYLDYAEKEIQKTYAAIARSSTQVTRTYQYPWRFVDESGVEADGFMKKAFGFELDQQRILDLLTGHTLYNDTSVVLRELTQNAIDAVRLQCAIEGVRPEDEGRIDIKWSDTTQTLEIIDNGTGMSQKVIENHLLKVGSSRYQDDKFVEEYPDFSSISRFGIGVLSAFMVADEVEITTCDLKEKEARRVSLRSVHGKYLIRLLDKVADREEIGVWPHGTRVQVKLRSTAELGQIMRTARQWLLFPRANVWVSVNQEPPVKIGYDGPRHALESYIASDPRLSRLLPEDIQVREEREGGLTLAFAVQRDPLFKDWNFVQRRTDTYRGDGEIFTPIATCVEGVGVEFTSPGFTDVSVVAVANATGKNAPKTNVARSAIEDTDENRAMTSAIYRLYARHVSSEISRLDGLPNNSLTRAVTQAPYLMAPFTSERLPVSNMEAMKEALESVPFVLVEEDGLRTNVSLSHLEKRDEYWTVEAPLNQSIEYFIREAPSNISSKELLRSLGNNVSPYPTGSVVCNGRNSVLMTQSLGAKFRITRVDAFEDMRRLDLRWGKPEDTSLWIDLATLLEQLSKVDYRSWEIIVRSRNEGYRGNQRFPTKSIVIPPATMEYSGLDHYGAFSVASVKYILPNQPISRFMHDAWAESDTANLASIVNYLRVLEALYSYNTPWASMTLETLKNVMENMGDKYPNALSTNFDKFIEAVRQSNDRYFDPHAWERRES